MSGETFTQMMSRWSTAVGAYAPEWVLLADPVNDATAGRTGAQMIADAQTIIALNKSIRARTILLTAPPNGGHTTGQRNHLNTFNNWVKWGNTDGSVVPVDVASAVTNPSTGAWNTPWSNDDLHQNRAGAARMARVIADALSPIVPARDIFPVNPGDVGNILPSPWNPGTPGSTLPGGWAVTGTGTGSLVARDDLIPGNWMRCDGTGSSGSAYLADTQRNLTTFAVGDRVRLAVEMRMTAAWTSLDAIYLQCQFRNSGSSVIDSIAALHNDNTIDPVAADQYALNETWVFQSPPMTIPVGTVYVKMIHTFTGQMKVDIGRQVLVAA